MEKSIYSARHKQLEDLLQQVREEAGIRQVELAERLNTGQSRVSDYERGERRMDLVQLEHYCKALGISLVEFVRRFAESEGEPDNKP